ncbi:MAG: HAMP domain-containing histidine kinase [Bacteroidetes bacterium]|nr:HAMP domain-containing histidine kinase [Bacteroidota bacterium]
MKKRPNSISLLLIACSLALVLALQTLWLRSAYDDARLQLTKEVNRLFTATLFAVKDSVIQKSIVPVGGDSVRHATNFFTFGDSIRLDSPMPKDSAVRRVALSKNAIRVEVYSSARLQNGHSDSSMRAIIGKATQLQGKGGQLKNFIVKISSDTLSTDSLKHKFGQALHKATIDLPFRILKNPKPEKTAGVSITSDFIPYNPICHYAARIDHVNAYLWKKIAPQIAFSIFSTLLTTFSFLVLYRSLRSQQQMMELKNDFIGNITHELKTPIATVSVALEALRDFDALKDPKKTEEYLTMAQNELGRLTLLTENVLKMATLEGGSTTFLKEKVDFSDMVERVLASMKLIIEKNQAVVSFQKEGEHFALEGHAVHLTNVVYNLLDNALKYSQPPTVITILLKENADHILFSIKDNGIGIAKEYHKKIFDKFFRVPTGNIHNTHGYGLGLNYVAEVLRLHRGTIHVESEPGQGSTFTIQLNSGRRE